MNLITHKGESGNLGKNLTCFTWVSPVAISCWPHQGRAVPSCPLVLLPPTALADSSCPLLALPWASGQYMCIALVLPVKCITKEASHFLCHLQPIFFS